MKTLTLPLKKKWFDMIKSGEKKEEYRECSDHWIRRFVKDFKTMSDFRFEMCFRAGMFLTDYLVSDVQDCLNCLDFDTLVFTLGYPKADDTERRLVFKNLEIPQDEYDRIMTENLRMKEALKRLGKLEELEGV